MRRAGESANFREQTQERRHAAFDWIPQGACKGRPEAMAERVASARRTNKARSRVGRCSQGGPRTDLTVPDSLNKLHVTCVSSTILCEVLDALPPTPTPACNRFICW